MPRACEDLFWSPSAVRLDVENVSRLPAQTSQTTWCACNFHGSCAKKYPSSQCWPVQSVGETWPQIFGAVETMVSQLPSEKCKTEISKLPRRMSQKLVVKNKACRTAYFPLKNMCCLTAVQPVTSQRLHLNSSSGTRTKGCLVGRSFKAGFPKMHAPALSQSRRKDYFARRSKTFARHARMLESQAEAPDP